MIHDGLQNLVSGMGTARDKAGKAKYFSSWNTADIESAYEYSSLVQRVVDLPAEDAVREWRSWQAESVEISDIEAEEKRLGLKGKVLEARRLARVSGGAAILIGTGDANVSEPIDVERVQKGGIKYLTLLSRDDLTGGDIGRDVLEPGYGKPLYWSMTSSGGSLNIHPSRLVLLHGVAPLADVRSRARNNGWGISSLAGMMDRVMAVDETAGNILSLVYEAKVDVFKIPELMANLQQRGPEYEREVLRRLALAATGKGTTGALLMDSEEEYIQKVLSFGGLHEVLDRMMQLASAASGIPVTLLFGISPGGMNATGDNDIRNYYDRVKVEQEARIGPAMHVLDECLIRSALGERPADVFYEWSPLWQPTEKERADTGKVIADTFKIVAEIGELPAEVTSAALVNALTENGSAPGLERLAKEHFEEGTDD